ncbi:MAG: hypothetical protein E7301_02120 [Butyrivibrio sp.]|nr:hypothetical protein [Butyrivibrio sp.]
MRRKVIYKSTAIKAVVIVFALLMIMSLFPLRIWQRDIPFGAEFTEAEETVSVNDYHDVVQKFDAYYDRLSSIDIYVNSVEGGEYLSLVIYDENMQECYERYIHVGEVTEPGYVNVPLKLGIEVGKKYTLLIRGCLSNVSLGIANDNDRTSGLFSDFAYHDTGVQGKHLLMGLHYEQPLTKGTSLMFIAVICVLAAITILCVDMVYKKKEDSLITVHQVIRYAGNPIAILLTICLMFAIYPMKVFDDRVLDIIFYEIGAAITGLLMLYAINHENDATLDIKLWHNTLNLLKMGAIAGALWFCCEYMNALYTIFQTLAERKEVISLLVFLCLALPRQRVFKLYNLIYAVAAVICGAFYRNRHLIPDTEKEYDLNNAATLYGIIIVVLLGFFIINIVPEMLKKKERKYKVSVFGWMFILFLAAIVVFRNTRFWGIVLAIFVICLMASYYGIGFRRFEYGIGKDTSNDAKRGNGYLELVCGGMLLNFVLEMIYSLLYRDFAAFNTGRFPFVFHTVTITAEYMTVMMAASMSLLLYKIYVTRDTSGFMNRFRYLWKEFIMFGLISAYMIFTMSRTAYLACVVMALMVFILTATDNRNGRLKYLGRQIAVMAVSVIVLFPVAFTLQRTIPALVMRPVWFIVEPENVAMYGGAQPGSRLYMGVERFADLFCEKILNKDLIDYNYPQDSHNYDEKGHPIYGENGVVLTKDQAANWIIGIRQLLADPQTSEETRQYLMDTAGYELGLDNPQPDEASLDAGDAGGIDTEEASSEDGDDFTNGRISIFKSYLEQMTFEGHDEMGAVLADGEVAVHAHNTYLQVMYDNGIIAGVLFFLLMATAFISSIVYYIKKRDIEQGALIPYTVTVGFGVAAVSEWVFQLSNPMAIAFVLAVIPIAFIDRKR